MRRFVDSITDEDGQTVAEYAVTISIITAAIVVSIALLSDTTRGIFQDAINSL